MGVDEIRRGSESGLEGEWEKTRREVGVEDIRRGSGRRSEGK